MIILARLVALHGLMVLVHAQTSPSGSSSAQASSASDTPDPMVCITGSVEEGNCLSAQSNLVVNTLSPAGGPLDGNTRVIVIGHGFRNFGSLMRCRFGSREVPSRLYVAPGTVASPYNHTMVACESPEAPTTLEQDVALEVTLNGNDYSVSGRRFNYYRHPSLVTVSPRRGSAATPQPLTITRSTAVLSGGWTPMRVPTHMCKFEAVVQPNGRRQVPFIGYANASVADATELQCASPTVQFVAPVRIEVTLNGQQYSSSGPVFTYEDNWHSPAVSGVLPIRRHGAASALVGSTAYYFGGETGEFHAAGEGFTNEFWALHLDQMTDYYPSETARDLAWQKLSLSTSGDTPTPRSYCTFVAWSNTLILFGGVSSVWQASGRTPNSSPHIRNPCPVPFREPLSPSSAALIVHSPWRAWVSAPRARQDMHNSTYEFSTTRNVWQQVAVSGGPVDPRSGHTATLCSLSVGCSTSDGRPRMFVFGGWGMAPCHALAGRPCLVHKDELVSLDLNSMSWLTVAVNAEQPKPPARKGHTANLVNGSILLIFGGSAWVPDPEADNSYGCAPAAPRPRLEDGSRAHCTPIVQNEGRR